MENPEKTYIALLRGVMPTGKNRVPMAELRNALAEAGLSDVRTYIQSGNVILRSGLNRRGVQSLIHQIIFEGIGADITVIARTRDEMEEIFNHNPYPPDTTQRTYFIFFDSIPDKESINKFLELDYFPDQVVLKKDSLYTLFATKYSDSKFNNNFIERKLNVAATTRNFNTINRLLELSA